MGILANIWNKIVHHGQAQAKPLPDIPASMQPQAQTPQAAPAAAQAQPVEVEQVLTQIAAQKGGGGNWRTSIVDLLKMLDMDSSLEARKELAQELNVHAGADGSAEQNMALSKAVWQQLAANGGQVPASLRD